MNREDIVKGLNRYVNSINPEFKVNDDGDLVLWVRYEAVAWFKDYQKDEFVLKATVDNDLAKTVIETEILNRFYIKAVELLNEMSEKKYTIKIFKNEYGFLYKRESDDYSNLITGELTNYNNRTYFTKSEIEKLKQRQDVAIDWDKAIIKEVDN